MKIKLTHPISAKEIEGITGCVLCGVENARIHSVATHSSEVEENTLFLAMQGEKTHGEAFRNEVIARGGFLLTEKHGDKSFCVPSVGEALFRLARTHLDKLTKCKHTIAITGSVGKTTTKEVLRRMLSDRYCTHATEGNQNSEIGLPLTILSAPTDTEILILEMGMNHKGELARLSSLATPDTILITNIGHAHVGNLGSRAAIAEAKKEILIGAKKNATVLIPSAEPLLSDVEDAIRIGLFCEDGDYALVKKGGGEHILLKGGEKILRIPQEIRDKGLLCAIAFSAVVAMKAGISVSKITDIISDFQYNIFRQKRFLCKKSEIVFDAYNASYESVLYAIEALGAEPMQARALLLGDMQELGEHESLLHRSVGSACAAARDKIDFLFLFGTCAPLVAEQAIMAGFDKRHIHVNADVDRPDITARAISPLMHKSTCLWIKGARGMRMERILKYLMNDAGDDNNAG